MQFWKWNCVWNISSTQQKRCSHISVHWHIKQNWPVHESHHVIMNTRKSEIVQIFTLPTLSKGESLVKSGNKSMKGKSPNLHPVHQKRRSLDPFSWAADIIKKVQDRGPKIPANHMFFIFKQDYQDDPGGGPRISANFPSISTLCRLLVTINSCAKGQRGVEEGRLQLSARIQK